MMRTRLPETIRLPCGAVLYPVIGGYLQNEPFLTLEHSGVDVTQNGWAGNLFDSQERTLIIAEAKRQGLKYRRISIIDRGLRGKKDLHGFPYRPTRWIFVEVR